MARAPIRDFELANPLYKNASVSFYTVAAGVKTSTLATLYAGPSAATQLANPQKLNSHGQFKQSVYIADEVIGVINGISVPGHDTAIHSPYPTFTTDQATGKLQYSYDGGVTKYDSGDYILVNRGSWVTATAYYRNDFVEKDGVWYVNLTAHTSGVFATDLAATKWREVMSLGFIQAGTGAQSRTMQDKGRERVTPEDFGAIADGSAHPLSEVYGSLAAAQAVYSFATALTQQIDWAAIQAACNTLTSGGEIRFSGKKYVTNADDVALLADTSLVGEGATISNTTTHIFTADSKSNIEISGFKFVGDNAAVVGDSYSITQAVLRCTDATAPCSNVYMHDNTTSEICLFNNWSALNVGAAYYLQYYRTASKVAQNLRFCNNKGATTASPTTAADYYISIEIGRQIVIHGNVIYGYYFGILCGAGEGTLAAGGGFDPAQDRYSGDAVVFGNTIGGTSAAGGTQAGAGIVVISASNVSVYGNTLSNHVIECLDAEDSSNVSFVGNTLRNVREAFTVFHDSADILFDSNNVTLAPIVGGVKSNVFRHQITTASATAGTVAFTNNVVAGVDDEIALFRFGTGGAKQWVVTGNTLTNIVGEGGFSHNGLVFDDNTLIYQTDPYLLGGAFTMAWYTGYPKNYVFNDSASVPLVSFCRNRLIGKAAAALQLTALQIQAINNQSASIIRMQNNYLECMAAYIIARNMAATATGKRTIFFTDNISMLPDMDLVTGGAQVNGPIIYGGGTAAANLVDRVYAKNNYNEAGLDIFGIDATGGTPSLAYAGSVPWDYTKETPFELGSKIECINPVTGQPWAWVCVVAGATNAGGAGVWSAISSLP